MRPAKAVCLATLLAAGLGGAASAQPRPHEQLVVGMTSFPPSEHPYIDPLIVKSWVLGFASRQVTMFTPDWQNVCSLCTEVPSLDNGRVATETQPDGKPGLAVRWTLRRDLFWGDGVPLTTKDIAYTAKVGGDPGSGFPDARVWGRVRSVDVVDDQTAVLHLDEVTPLYNRMGKLLSEHSDGPAYYGAAKPGDYLSNTVYNRAPTTPGLWNGPYLITGYDSGSQVVLEPNPHWTGKAPAIKRIVARSIADTAALQANLQSGDVDMAPGDAIGLQLDQVLAMQKDNPSSFQYIYNDALAFWNIDFDLDNKFLADVRVRRAVLLAIDRKTMSEKLAGGRFTLAATWVPPKEPMFAPGLPIVPYDPAQAKALLKEAGYAPGPDGILRNAGGERFSIDLRMGLGVRLMELVELVVQNQLKAVGIDVVLRNEVQRTFFRHNAQAPAVWRPGTLQLAVQRQLPAAPALRADRHSDRSERLGRQQLHGLEEPGVRGPAQDRRDHAGLGRAEGRLGGNAAHLRGGPARAAAVLRAAGARRPDLAQGLRAVGDGGLHDPACRGLACRVIRTAPPRAALPTSHGRGPTQA